MQHLLLHETDLCRGHSTVRRPVFLLTATLFLLTAALVLYRIAWLGYPVFPVAKGQTWQLLINVYLLPQKEDHGLFLTLPPEHTGNMVIEERVVSGAYSFNIQKQGLNRMGIWSATGANGPEEISYRATIHSRPRRAVTQSPLLSPYPPVISPEERKLIEDATRAWRALPPAARFQAVSSLLGEGRGDSPANETLMLPWRTLRQKHDRTESVLALFRAADLPARPVEGLRWIEGVQTAPVSWIEAWTGRAWANLNPETGEVYPVSTALLPLAVGGLPAVRAAGAEVSDIRWTLSRQIVSQWKLLYERISRSANFLDRWSLLQLPPEFQGTFRILLLVPIGALIISFLRNVVGLPTFGIFMPLLIALAFRSTGMLYGVTIFCGVLLVGYAVRSQLDKLRLLLVPRLSVILTLVIACFTLLALLGNRLGLREFMAVGLIPFVILTMTIERFFILIEESGTREAVITAAGSTAISVLTYWVISWEPLQLTFFVYPELILAVAGLQILLGRYTGYRLSELFRFRSMRGAS
jgi:hypothetical protein